MKHIIELKTRELTTIGSIMDSLKRVRHKEVAIPQAINILIRSMKTASDEKDKQNLVVKLTKKIDSQRGAQIR